MQTTRHSRVKTFKTRAFNASAMTYFRRTWT
jgi:hypothetical protein